VKSQADRVQALGITEKVKRDGISVDMDAGVRYAQIPAFQRSTPGRRSALQRQWMHVHPCGAALTSAARAKS
jgi:hypothetical protein